MAVSEISRLIEASHASLPQSGTLMRMLKLTLPQT
jgi:hypothetical protein